MEEKIKVTKENYKEYVELYKTIMSERKVITEKTIIIATLVYLILSCGTISLASTLISDMQSILGFVTVISSLITPVALIGYGVYKLENYHENKLKENFKRNHPKTSINIDAKINEIKEALEKVNIIRKEYKNGYVISHLDLNEFEERIRQEEYIEKCEESKEKLFEKYRYDYSSLEFNTSILPQELEKPKVKVKSLSRINSNNR